MRACFPIVSAIVSMTGVLASVLACARSQTQETDAAVPTKASSSPTLFPSASASPPTPMPTAAQGASPRYFLRVPTPTDSGWYAMVLGKASVSLLSPEKMREIPIANLSATGRRTTFTLRSPDETVDCAIEAMENGERSSFSCVDEPRYSLLELDPKKRRDEIERIAERITKLTPSSDICDRAERCCKAAWPLLVPGETCDVEFQLGRERFPDNCANALEGFRKVLGSKPIPPDCR